MAKTPHRQSLAGLGLASGKVAASGAPNFFQKGSGGALMLELNRNGFGAYFLAK